MPCLAEATATLLVSKLGSGGLKCDFGSLNDIMITPKRSSLGGELTEASMMLKLNKHLMLYDPGKLMLLDNYDWENHIPKRPIYDEELQIEDDDSSLV
jgi:hypothetical protein